MADIFDASNVGTSKGRAGGYAWVAPAGTELPTSANGELSEEFESLGYVSEDGLSCSSDVDTNDVNDWAGNLIKRDLTSFSEEYAVTFLEARESVLKVIYGDGNYAEEEDSGIVTVKHNAGFMNYERVFVFDYYVGAERLGRTVIPRGVVSEQDDRDRNATDTTEFAVTITALADDDGNTAYDYIQS